MHGGGKNIFESVMMKRLGSVSRRWMKSSAGAAAHGGRWVWKQAQVEEKNMRVKVGAALLASAKHLMDSTSQQTFFCGCANEADVAGQMAVAFPPCADSVGGRVK
jgi:hypothetical protein